MAAEEIASRSVKTTTFDILTGAERCCVHALSDSIIFGGASAATVMQVIKIKNAIYISIIIIPCPNDVCMATP